MARQKLYKNLKLQERLILFLGTLGWVEIESRNKYRMMTKKCKNLKAEEMVDAYLFLGSSGAVRFNTKKSAAGSISRTDKYLAELKKYEIASGLMGE